MTTLMIILGWLMIAAGVIGITAVSFHLWPARDRMDIDPDRSDFEQIDYAFGSYLYGAALLLAFLGAALLRANGVDFGWPESR